LEVIIVFELFNSSIMDHPTTTTGKKKRPRTVLLSLFPKGVVTPQEASDALRKSGGNLEEAKKLLDNQLMNSKPAATVKGKTIEVRLEIVIQEIIRK